jgi:outer membrane protein TolC
MNYLALIIMMISFGKMAIASEPMTLTAYLQEVESQNLSLKASAASLEAAEARSVGLKLPEPMVAYIQMQDSSGTANGFEVSQTIPFPTKLTSDHGARKIEAEVEKANAASTRNEVLAKARLLYISVWAAQEKVAYLKEKRAAVQQHLKLSNATTRSDSSLRIHTVKAESDVDLIEGDILEAEQVLTEQRLAFAELAQKDPATYQPTVETPPLTEIPKAAALKNPSQLEAKKFNVERLDARSTEANSSWLPDFNIRYRDVGATGMMPALKEIMVGATIPFAFFWQPRAASKSAKADKMKAEAEYNQEQIRVQATTASLLARSESLKKQIDLINNKLLPRAKKRMNLIRNLAPRDMESLQEHREGMEQFPDLKLKALDLRMQFESTVAELAAFATGESK